MADKISINRITNANVYIDGNNMLGRIEEINLPTIKFKTVEHKTLGLIATLELPAGVEKLEGKIKWSSFYADVLKLVSNPHTFIPVQVRGSLDTYNAQQGRSAEVPVVAAMTVFFKELPAGNFKQHDAVELETNFSALYMKLTVGAEDIVEIDVLSNIYKAGGVDILSNYRANIGG